MRAALTYALLALCMHTKVDAQSRTFNSVATAIENSFAVTPNLVYRTVGGVDAKLDVYMPRAATGPIPTLVYFFGGGWVTGSKERAVMRLTPWLAKGWAVVNVDYRLAKTALAPAAVEDARCALWWVFRNAKDYHFDSTRVVVAGHSAGGQLALMAGLAPTSAGFERGCAPHAVMPRVASIVNSYGPTFVRSRDPWPADDDFADR